MNLPLDPLNQNKAKLFLSCGQNADFEEPKWAKEIESRLTALGFDVFYAVEQQTHQSLTGVIFHELREADYYLFIDFKREKIAPHNSKSRTRKQPVYRGSLFSHQEFAIACFLGLDLLAFRERGVEPLTGVVGAVMANAHEFTSRRSLPQAVEDEIRKKLDSRLWSVASTNRLGLLPKPLTTQIDTQTNPNTGREQKVSHFHIAARNFHNRKPATSCFAYVDSILDAQTRERFGPDYTCELKWEGTHLQGIRVGPGTERGIDAFILVIEPEPRRLIFVPQTDATNHINVFDRPVELIVTYAVCSDEFPDARQSFLVKFDGRTVVDFSALPES